MRAEGEAVAHLDRGLLRFFNLLLRIELIVLELEHVVPDVGEVSVVEPDVEEELGVERLQELVIP